MKKKLLNKLKILNQETEKIHAALGELSEENLHDQSYGWSILEVLAHLNMAEAGSVVYMKKKMQAGDQMLDAGVKQKIRSFLAKYFMQSSLKWKAPPVVASPQGDISYDEIKNKWEKTRKGMEEYIQEFPEEYLSKQLLKHPLAGRLTLEGAIDSFIHHQRHHVHQIKRIRKKIGV